MSWPRSLRCLHGSASSRSPGPAGAASHVSHSKQRQTPPPNEPTACGSSSCPVSPTRRCCLMRSPTLSMLAKLRAWPHSTVWSHTCANRRVLVLLRRCETSLMPRRRARTHAAVAPQRPAGHGAASRSAWRGEITWRVPPLSPEDAVGLFVERGLSRRDRTSPADRAERRHHRGHLSAGRRHTTRYPAPAVARVRALSVEGILSGLDDRFRLLAGGSRTALPRQQTLQASVEWSHELLTGAEQSPCVASPCSPGPSGWRG